MTSSCSDHARIGFGSCSDHVRIAACFRTISLRFWNANFARQAQYLVRLESDACCSAHWK